jgi:hypothetical protein
VLGGTPAFAADLADRLRRLGWDACAAASADDLQVFAMKKSPATVVLPAEGELESGFLTCAKLRLTIPKLRVVLVGTPTAQAERFARFVGARLATEETAADVVLNLI